MCVCFPGVKPAGDLLPGSHLLKIVHLPVDLFQIRYSFASRQKQQISNVQIILTCILMFGTQTPRFPHALALFVCFFAFRFPKDHRSPEPIACSHFALGPGYDWIPSCVYPKCVSCPVHASSTRRALKNTYEEAASLPAFIKHAARCLRSSVCLFKDAPRAAPVAPSHLKIRSERISSLQRTGFHLFICASLYINIAGFLQGYRKSQWSRREIKRWNEWRFGEKLREGRQTTAGWK